MKRLLLGMAATIVATAAFAQDETASEVTHSGDIRVRYFNYMNPTSIKDANDDNAFVENRVKLNLNFQKSEDLSAFVSLLYSGLMGDQNQTVPHTYATDGVSVNQAYLWWKANETTSLTAGRMAIDIADGRVFSYNDYEVVPTTHDGLKVGFDFDFGNLGIYAIKSQDNTFNSAGAPAAGVNQPSNDPESNTYLLSLDFKNLPEALSTANLHIAQSNTDAVIAVAPVPPATGVTAAGSTNLQHIGLTLGGESNAFNYNFTAAFQTGKVKNIAGDTDLSGSMYDLLLGYTLSEQGRVWVGYHMDSGDDNPADNKVETYNSVFYNAHDNAGRMDIFGWGNLTYIYLGGAYNLSEATEIGLEALMFSKTEDQGGVTMHPYRGGNYAFTQGTPASTDGDLGTEIDVWATHSYDNGANIGARLGYFTPGKFYSDGTGARSEESSMQLMLTGGFNF